MTLRARLNKLAVLSQAPTKAIEECAWSFWAALKYPHLDTDTEAWYARIVASHGLGEADLRRALVLALMRRGIRLDEAVTIASLGPLEVMRIAAEGWETA